MPAGVQGATDDDEARVNTHEEHNAPLLDAASLPPDVARRIDALTPADQHVYSAAAVRVVREMRAAERATSVRLLCPAEFEALVNRTRYIAGLEVKLRETYRRL